MKMMNKKRGGMLTDALLGLLVMSVVTAAVYTAQREQLSKLITA